MKDTIKKATAAVVSFFGIGALTACYGMPPDRMEDLPNVVYGKVLVVDQNGDTSAISKGQVTIQAGNRRSFRGETDENGFFNVPLPDGDQEFKIFFTDADGKYQQDTASFKFTDGNTGVNLDLMLKNK
ncbi:MAG: hypothetical protein J6V76_00235 [Bacteroidales bacterium]|nr:hypothetical protein [Bacteroidales bacterium]